MQTFSVAIRYSEKRGYVVIPNQELIALGMCHILSSFTQALDATGSYSRTGVKANSGARTQFTGFIELTILFLTLFVLTPLFYYIPKSALAAIVISAVVSLFEPEGFKRMWRTKPRDFWVAVLTALITTFASATYGLLSGVAISLLLIVWRSSHPPHAVLGLVSFPAPEGAVPVQHYRNVERYPEAKQEPGILVWRFDAELWFANVSYFREKLQGELAKRRVGPIEPYWGADEEVVVDEPRRRSGFAGGESVVGEQGVLVGLGISNGEAPSNGAEAAVQPAPLPAIQPPPPDDRIRVLVLDMTSVVDVDSSGAQALLTLNTTLRKSQKIEILFAGVKGPVRDVLWRATGGRILEEKEEPKVDKGKASGKETVSPASPESPPNGDQPATDLQPDEPPMEGDVPMIALEDRDGNITIMAHPAPETLPRVVVPDIPQKNFFGQTIRGTGNFGTAKTAPRDLYVEQFFLSVSGAVEFAKKLVVRQRAKEARKKRLGFSAGQASVYSAPSAYAG
jgi:hypothetical protein